MVADKDLTDAELRDSLDRNRDSVVFKVEDLTLQEEYPREVRNTLITQLTQRQRLLQDMRALLEQSAPQFLEYHKLKTYAGDTYPDGIGKLNTMLGAYKEPQDAIAAALGALKTKYSLNDSEL